MSNDFLDDRRRALEEAFFAKQGQDWLRQQREAGETKVRTGALAAASGITDVTLLERLVGLGLNNNSMVALSLVPLVVVAWADGSLDERERAALLSAAAEAGVERQGESYQWLSKWLAEQPPPQLLDTWTDYIRATSGTLAPDAREALKSDLLGRARRVAEAAGGFLGIGRKISAAEEAVLERLTRAFSA